MTDHKQEAREIARIYAAESEGIRDGCERAIELLCASVERETITSIATCIQVAAIAEQNGIARVSLFKLASEIRALAEEASSQKGAEKHRGVA